jgi:hypothetical protein
MPLRLASGQGRKSHRVACTSSEAVPVVPGGYGADVTMGLSALLQSKTKGSSSREKRLMRRR